MKKTVTCKICDYKSYTSLQCHMVFKHKISPKKYKEIYGEKEQIHTKIYLDKRKDVSLKSWKNDEIRFNRVEALKKAHNSPEAKKNHSKATTKFCENLTPEQRTKKNNVLKEIWAKPENRKKLDVLSKIGLKAAMAPEGRKNFLIAQRTPEIREKRSLCAKKNISKILLSRKRYSKLNEFLENKLILAGYIKKIDFIPEYSIGPYVVDFCFQKSMLVVEADGDWWHANPEFMKERNITTLHPIQKKMNGLDKAKNSYLKNHGWRLLRFWERDLHKNSECCITKIKEALNDV